MNKPEFLEKVSGTVSEKVSAMQPRERLMIGGALLVLVGMIIFTIFHSMFADIETMKKETENYRKSLNYIAENQKSYFENKARADAIREKLQNADAKIANKITSIASNLGFDVTVTPKDAKKVDDSTAEEQEIEVTLKNVDYNKFLEFIIQVSKLESPVYMRHINMNRTSNNSGPDTKMTVSISLISYRIKEGNEK